MAKFLNYNEAIDVIHNTVVENGAASDDASVAMAEGIFGGLLVGYAMDETAFLALHGDRLEHLTRNALTAARKDVTPQPGAMPTNI